MVTGRHVALGAPRVS